MARPLDGRGLAYRPDALLSHLSALALHGLRPDNRAVADVTVPSGRARSRTGIHAHGYTSLADADRAILDGIPCTSLSRTVLDCAPRLGYQGVEKAIDRAEILRVFDRLDLEKLLARARGHRGTALVRSVLGDAREPDWTDNDYEAAVLALVRTAGLSEPICQAPMVLGGEPGPDRLPVAAGAGRARSRQLRVPREPSGLRGDRRRDQLLLLAGFEPLRITWRQLSRHPEQVEELLRDRLGPVS